MTANKRLLRVLAGEALTPPPVWLMRQAGRYLPEYRQTRQQAGSFLDLCYNPRLATEVTLQPIRRYGFDAAILFADILIVPHALGQDVRFVEGEGPRLDPVRDTIDLTRLDLTQVDKKFSLIYETVARLRQDLPRETTLIGFCGAPWTVATYMVEGAGSKDHATARLWAYRDPTGFQRLIDIITQASISYLSGQISAGAEVVQIFDTWAGSLANDQFDRWVIAPTRRIVEALRDKHPRVPVIGFPRGAGMNLERYVRETGVSATSCDVGTPLGLVRGQLSDVRIALQGNIDPLLLVAGGRYLDLKADAILEEMTGYPHIFNLGHGIVPQTPPDHVEQLVRRIRDTVHAG